MRSSGDGTSERKTKIYSYISTYFRLEHYNLSSDSRVSNKRCIHLIVPPCRITNTRRVIEKVDYITHIITIFGF